MKTLSISLAIFSMFFGAGNVVFPLLLGKVVGEQFTFGALGLLITSIGGPLIGLFGAILFHGHFREFFARTGMILSPIFILVTAALLGPFAVMPRCIVVAYAAISSIFPAISLMQFSFISLIVVLLLLWKKTGVLDILGYVLSPLLLLCLLIIIYKGIATPGITHPVDISHIKAFTKGITTGYDTMDLIAAIYFSVSIWNLLKVKVKQSHVTKTTFIAGSIAGILLGLVYVGLGFAASRNMDILGNVPPEKLLVAISYHLLGPQLGILANIAVALACLTTVMGLAVTFAEIIRRDFGATKLNYGVTIFILVFISALFSNLGFTRIMEFIHPLVAICYPAIITLTLCNIAYKCYGFKLVKTPVVIVLALTLFMLINS
ncbi:MAG: Branched-chain amino acid transport system 2 carrier protein [Chlamydiia bacterium]|nr:Branched-chain amino acid transport system 2 carrier protein [Chlamydiia bacterium]MCH9616284.1 Branched-chain amino acid transport system 2 carrier protein [Chlamydiia bacterium]MCH9629730.1 Branched-chain amino acid transport system 2 carrier protein [Chlamydiia bacterium]